MFCVSGDVDLFLLRKGNHAGKLVASVWESSFVTITNSGHGDLFHNELIQT